MEFRRVAFQSYPSDPVDKKRPDEQYMEEYNAGVTAGFLAGLFSFEDFEAGTFKASIPFKPGDTVLYRGWMLTVDAYADLVSHLRGQGAIAVTSPPQYRHCHHLPEWYPLFAVCTNETVVLSRHATLITDLKGRRNGLDQG